MASASNVEVSMEGFNKIDGNSYEPFGDNFRRDISRLFLDFYNN